MNRILATVLSKEPLFDVINRHFAQISYLYDNVIIEVTSQTNQQILDWFDLNYPGIYYVNKGPLGQVRRRVLAKALDLGADVVHFADLDRLLYWRMSYPYELEYAVKSLDLHTFTVFGRTKAAMDSHPTLQRLTEQACNHLFSTYVCQEIDILAASRGIPREIGLRILQQSKEDNPACVDAEWCIIAETIKEIRVNGLGYESNLLSIEKDLSSEIKARVNNLKELGDFLSEHINGRF